MVSETCGAAGGVTYIVVKTHWDDWELGFHSTSLSAAHRWVEANPLDEYEYYAVYAAEPDGSFTDIESFEHIYTPYTGPLVRKRVERTQEQIRRAIHRVPIDCTYRADPDRELTIEDPLRIVEVGPPAFAQDPTAFMQCVCSSWYVLEGSPEAVNR